MERTTHGITVERGLFSAQRELQVGRHYCEYKLSSLQPDQEGQITYFRFCSRMIHTLVPLGRTFLQTKYAE